MKKFLAEILTFALVLSTCFCGENIFNLTNEVKAEGPTIIVDSPTDWDEDVAADPDSDYHALPNERNKVGTNPTLQISPEAKLRAYTTPAGTDESFRPVADLIEDYPFPRNQGNYGTCWAHAAVGLGEFNLVNKSRKNNTVNYSEYQHAYFTYHHANDPLLQTGGDSFSVNNWLDDGGTLYASAQTLAGWEGLVEEEDAPYANASLSASLSNDYAYSKDEAHLEDFYIVNWDSSNNYEAIKQAIVDYGAVGVSYYAFTDNSDLAHVYSGEKTDFNDATNAYFTGQYCPHDQQGDAYSNHAVMIVGWDDTFAATNFVEGNRPEHNGAWLVRNSWFTQGDDTFESYNSYFWMSYEEESLVREAAYAFNMASYANYDNNYQYDGSVATNKMQNYSVANVFTAKANVVEDVKAVSVFYGDARPLDSNGNPTNTDPISYNVKVYHNISNPNDPTSGTLKSEKTGTFKGWDGLETIELGDDSFSVSSGDTFSVVVTLSSSGGVMYESNWSNEIYRNTASSERGKSFILSGNDWYDFVALDLAYSNGAIADHGNFCIKAYTDNNNTYKALRVKCYDITNNEELTDACSVEYTDSTDTFTRNAFSRVLAADTSFSLSAVADSGYTFEGWKIFTDGEAPHDLDDNYTGDPYNANLSNNLTCYAVFSGPKKLNDSNTTISGLGSYTYTGSAHTPQPTVTVDGTTLVMGTDYDLSYANNTNAGTATVTITGKGDYVGSLSRNFTIAKASQSPTMTVSKSKLKVNESLPVTVKNSVGAVSYSSSNTKVAAISGNKIVGKGAGTATITVNVAGNSNYYGKVASFKVTVERLSQSVNITTVTQAYKFDDLKKNNKTFKLSSEGAKTAVTYKKKSGNSMITVAGNGKVTVKKGIKKGTYKLQVTVTAKQTSVYNSASKTVTVPIIVTGKSTQGISIATGNQTFKFNDLKKKAKTFNLKSKGNKTSVTYTKVSGDKNITVDKKGKVTVKKGIAKGTYSVRFKIAAKADSKYEKAENTKVIKVTVK